MTSAGTVRERHRNSKPTQSRQAPQGCWASFLPRRGLEAGLGGGRTRVGKARGSLADLPVALKGTCISAADITGLNMAARGYEEIL